MVHGRFFSKIAQLKAEQCNMLELPFADVLSEDRLGDLLKELGISYRDRIFTPCVTLWTFMWQVLSSDQCCRNAMARLQAHRAAQGQRVCSADTSSYCAARQRLPMALLARLVRETGKEIHDQTPLEWLAHGRRVKLVDGTTVSMPDTAENAAAFGKSNHQKTGNRFPLARVVAVSCLATGVVLEQAIGPYRGKQTGEISLFRSLKDCFEPNDILLGDRLFCSFADIVRMQRQAVDVIFRLHASRKADFRRGRRLGRYDHLVIWKKPKTCPPALSPEEFAALPAELMLREVRVRVELPGVRTKVFVVVTTLIDPKAFSAAVIASLYRQRWHAELDLRSIKAVMQMDVLRCKTPAMVRKEILAHLLAYNLLRSMMCAAAEESDCTPREISFKGTMQVLNAYHHLIVTTAPKDLASLCSKIIKTIVQYRVGDRPNRYEPRKRKRAPKPYPPLKRSRNEERKQCA